MSQPAYSWPSTTRQVPERLREATLNDKHILVPDEISLADPGVVKLDGILSHKTTINICLRAPAVAHNARFVTFDHGVSLRAIVGATTNHLVNCSEVSDGSATPGRKLSW